MKNIPDYLVPEIVFLVALLVLLILGFLFFYYGLPGLFDRLNIAYSGNFFIVR